MKMQINFSVQQDTIERKSTSKSNSQGDEFQSMIKDKVKEIEKSKENKKLPKNEEDSSIKETPTTKEKEEVVQETEETKETKETEETKETQHAVIPELVVSDRMFFDLMMPQIAVQTTEAKSLEQTMKTAEVVKLVDGIDLNSTAVIKVPYEVVDLKGMKIAQSMMGKNQPMKQDAQLKSENQVTSQPVEQKKMDTKLTDITTEILKKNQSLSGDASTGKQVQHIETQGENTLPIAEQTTKEAIPVTDTEVVHIKVGNTKLSESWQKVADAIGKEILMKHQNGIDKFKISLNPQGLGKIDVEITNNPEGMKVSLLCNVKSTMNLISENILGLSKIVESSFGADVIVQVYDETGKTNQDHKHEFNDKNSNGNQQHDDKRQQEEQENEGMNFLERMRLGLLDEESIKV